MTGPSAAPARYSTPELYRRQAGIGAIMSRIVVAGAFDTKAEPLGLLVRTLGVLGAPPITIDTGVFGGDHGCAYPAEAVAEAAGLLVTGSSSSRQGRRRVGHDLGRVPHPHPARRRR